MKNFTKLMLSVAFVCFTFGAFAQPTAAPTAPDEPVSNVISIYGTDTYTPITGVDALVDWGQTGNGSTISEYTIPSTSHKVLKYGNLTFQGIDFSGNAQDVSDMKYLHLDIWTEDAASTPLWVAIISGSQNIAVEKTITTDGTWYSLDIPLSEYVGSTLTSINQIMFTSAEWRTTATNNSSATIYLDNIYFWTDVSAAVVLSTAQLTVDSGEGSTGTFNITSSNTWTVASDETWLTPDPASGSGNATITLTASANTELAERTATVTVTGFDDSFKTVKVTQRGVPVTDPIAPTAAAEDVQAIFSDPYTPLAVVFQNWFGTTITDETSTTATNNVKKVTSECCFGYEFTTPADLSSMDKLHIDIYPTTITSITLGIVANGEHKKTITLTPGVWNPIDITLSELTTVENLASVAQVGFWDIAGTFYMDNLYFYKAGAVSDTEDPTAFTATKGDVSSEGVELLLNATDNSGAVIYKVSYGDGPTVETVNGVSGTEKSYVVMGLEPSTAYSFSVTVEDAAGNTAANNPIVIAATTSEVPAGPVPDIPESRVISIYSDSYTDLSGTNYPVWGGQTTQVTDVTLGSNNAQKYTTFNYSGIELASSLDASEMDTLHVDIYTEYETNIRITPVSSGAEFPVALSPLTAGQWNSFDIPLTSFTGVNTAAIIQFKLDGGTGKTFYLDNLFLYKEGPAADTEAPTAFTAVTGTITFESVELLLKATDNTSDITYTISYGEDPTVLTTTGTSGVETSFVVTGLEASTAYSFTITAEDASGNKASAIVVPATTTASTTGINSSNHSNFRIYPNPVESKIFIDDLSLNASVKIFDMGGKLMTVKQNVSKGINVENLSKGVYFIQIIDDKSIITRKFIKK